MTKAGKRLMNEIRRYYTFVAPGEEGVVLAGRALRVLSLFYLNVRTCQGCGVAFEAKHGRQLYHDKACAFQARWAKFSLTRKRNYRVEYEQRMRRQRRTA